METHATFCLSPDYEDFTELTFYGSDGGGADVQNTKRTKKISVYCSADNAPGAGEYEVRSIMFPYKLKRKPKVRRCYPD